MKVLSDIYIKGKPFFENIAEANGSPTRALFRDTKSGEVVEKDITTDKDWVSLGRLDDGQHDFTEQLSLEQGEAYTARITVQCAAKDGNDRMTAQVIADMAVFYVNIGAYSAHDTDGVSIVSNVGAIIPDRSAMNPMPITSIKMGDILIEPYKPSNILQFKITNNTGVDNVNIRYHIETVKHDMLKTR